MTKRFIDLHPTTGDIVSNFDAALLDSDPAFTRGWTMASTASGTHNLAGVFEQQAAGQNIDGESSPDINDMGRQHLMIDITAITTPGTLRITGTSYDEDTGSTTGADTEDIVIGAGETGFYQSAQLWQGDIIISQQSAIVCSLDAYRFDPWGHDEFLPNSTLEHFLWNGKATSPGHSIQMQAFKFDPVARTMATFYDVTRTSANGKTFGDHRHWLSGIPTFAFNAGEGLYVRVITTNVEDLHIEFGFQKF